MRNKVTADVKNYDIKHQQYLLNQVFNSGDLYSRCKNILRAEYFDPIFRSGIMQVSEHVTKYQTLPTVDHIHSVYGMEIHETDVKPEHHEVLLDTIEEFCKHKAMENAIINSAPLLQEKRYGAVEKLIQLAMQVSLQKDIGLDIYEDPTKVITDLAAMQGTFKSGWDTLDYKLNGGFGRGELEIFAAASGGGKSVVLQNLAVNFSTRGVHGAYVTLELAEELVANRIYGMMLETKGSSLRSNLTGTHSKIKLIELTSGGLHVKRMPESISTVNDIETYLRELVMRTGKKLDYVCVDYLDLLTSDRVVAGDNVFTKDKFVSEELRAMAGRLDITVFTACQFNRSGVDADQKSQSQISGGISKIFTADNVIYIDAHKDRGEMIFDFQKTRNSGAVGQRLRMAYNSEHLKVEDHEDVVMELESLSADFRRTRKAKAVHANITGSPSANPPPQKVLTPEEQENEDVQSSADALKARLNARLNPLQKTNSPVLETVLGTVQESEPDNDDTPPWDEQPEPQEPEIQEVPQSSAINNTELKTAAMRAFLAKSRNR